MSHPATTLPFFDTLTIVGVGLLGGSIARAAKQRGLVRRVIGVGRNAVRLEQARQGGLLDEIQTDLLQVAAQSDLMVFATPVNLIVPKVREAATTCRPETLLTDVGSTKSHICRELATGLPPELAFVGSHPLAGSHLQGWEHARTDLFEGRVCVVTPIETSPQNTVERLTSFWRAIGMTVLEMSPETHDRALAQTSHVPHVVASALAQTLAEEHRSLAATGFADTTRIAAGDPQVWVPILMDNRNAVLARLDEFASQVTAFREALDRGDADELRRLWERGKAIREQLQVRRVAE
jgi:prephenate dehydrogenase